MARRTKAEMAQTRIALLASARKSFALRGYADTALDDVCTEIGLSRGALYHHFKNKKALLQAVVEVLDLEMDQRLQHSFEIAADPWEGFQNRCKLYLSMAQEPEIQRIILQDARAVLGHRRAEDAQQCTSSMQQILQQLMQEAVIYQSDAAALAILIHGSLSEATFWIADSTDSQPRLAQSLAALQLLLNGLRVR
ncbi:TetR family transcriptional regulator [Acinetobacter calcoaceticus]|uniref:TetR family transcriptional regulator n=1 Tax=Acinetobacter calcoaceticus TaxID=471 RepID=A0A4V2QZN1_ACICA|nr:TetR family transcriptional regulator [Acinetobacter calcoaceticus]